RRHQFPALLGHVLGEHRLDRWGDLEQAIVEDGRGLIGNRRDLGEALLDEFDLIGSHLSLRSVMRGLDPRIHLEKGSLRFRWIAGSSPAMTKAQRSPHQMRASARLGAPAVSPLLRR